MSCYMQLHMVFYISLYLSEETSSGSAQVCPTLRISSGGMMIMK